MFIRKVALLIVILLLGCVTKSHADPLTELDDPEFISDPFYPLSEDERAELGEILEEVLSNAVSTLFDGPVSLMTSPVDPPREPANPAIVETETEVTITITTGSLTITIRVNKKLGKTKITVCGLEINGISLPCLTFWVRPSQRDIVDDLPWPLETKFCTWAKQADGSVEYDCDFDYFGVIKFKGKLKSWINDNGEICFQIDDRTPHCRPMTDQDIDKLWKRLKLPYLPSFPREPEPTTDPTPASGSSSSASE